MRGQLRRLVECRVSGNNRFLTANKTFLTACGLHAAGGTETQIDIVEGGECMRASETDMLGSVSENAERAQKRMREYE